VAERCPHRTRNTCPLYIASATISPAVAQGCFDLEDGCAVDRGRMSYRKAAGAAALADPVMVFDCYRRQREDEGPGHD